MAEVLPSQTLNHMRLILIIVGIGAILWFVGGKAIDAFRLQGARDATAKFMPTIPAPPPVAPSSSASGSGPGSFPASLQRSLTPEVARTPDVLQSYRFTDRMPPEIPSFGSSVSAIYDRDSRVVMLKGPEKEVACAMLALRDLDLSADSCEVRTWAVYADRSLGNGWDLGAVLSSVSGADLGLSVGGGSASITLNGNQVAAALDVIANGAAVDVLQRPHLTLLHGQISEVEAADEVPLPQVSVSGNGFSQSGIIYRKVGLKLRVTPQFLGRDRVRLAVDQENGLIGSNVEVSPGLSAPVISTQRVSSSCEIAIGETVILGGVATDRLVRKTGFLKDTTERQRGFLFVVLSTAPSSPRALDPASPLPRSPFPAVPLSSPLPSAAGFSAWDDAQLLPPLD